MTMIYLKPLGGLCNRMRTIDSHGIPLRKIWTCPHRTLGNGFFLELCI